MRVLARERDLDRGHIWQFCLADKWVVAKRPDIRISIGFRCRILSWKKEIWRELKKKKKAKSLLFELDQMSCLEMEFSLSMFGAL